MEQAYAQALWKMVEKGLDAKKAVAALLEILKKHGRGALLPRIGKAFQRLAAREMQKQSLVLSVAREKDESRAIKEARAILKELGEDQKHISIKIDENLVGGWRLEGRGRLVDASYRK